MSLSSSQSPLVPEQDKDAFTELEHTNWQRGVDAYEKGFGSLTSQAVSTLLDRAGFLSLDIDGADRSASTSTSNRHSSLLDVACGPGQVIDAAISREAATGSISSISSAAAASCCSYTALDFSSNFLELAKKNLQSKHPNKAVTFVEGDAQNLSSVFGKDNDDDDDDDSKYPQHQRFDSVTSNFGILHLVDPDSFLSESYHVLKPGGRLAFSAWSAPPTTEGFDLILGSVRHSGNPDVVLPDGPAFFRFSDPTEIRRSLEAAGFVDIDVTVLDSMEWNNVGSSELLYDILLEGTARTRELLRGQTMEETKAVQKELKRRFEELATSVTTEAAVGTSAGRRPLRMPAVISSGRKPLL